MKSSYRLIGVLLIFVFCIFTLDYAAEKVNFLVLGLVLYGASIALILSNRVWMHISGTWAVILLVLQTLLTPLVIDRNLKTLQPNLNLVVDVKDGYSGIEGKQVITTDSKGFRNARGVNYDSDESYRIFAIGGSTTEEIRLDDSLTWVARLENILQARKGQPVEVINTGLAGLRAEHHLATLRHILKFNPNMVVFLQGINDWNWHIKNRDVNPLRIKLSDMRAMLVLSNSLLGRAAQNIYWSIARDPIEAGVEKFIEDHGEYYRNKRGSLNRTTKIVFKPERVHSHYRNNVDEIINTCVNNTIQCVFLTQPTGYSLEAERNFLDSFWMTPPGEQGKPPPDFTLTLDSMIHISGLYNDYLLKIAAEKEIPGCNLAAEIAPSFDYFYDDCHFNINGANAVAISLGRCLSEIIPAGGN